MTTESAGKVSIRSPWQFIHVATAFAGETASRQEKEKKLAKSLKQIRTVERNHSKIKNHSTKYHGFCLTYLDTNRPETFR